MKDRFARAIYNASYVECPSIYQELVDNILSLFEEEITQSNSQLLDALYGMYIQYCPDGHDFMGAGEDASELLEDYKYIEVDGAGRITKTLINNLKKGLK